MLLKYDPFFDFFLAQSQRPKCMDNVDNVALGSHLRALLVTDGTVTKLLEALYLEPIDVEMMSGETRYLASNHEWLDAREGERVAEREVVLRGQHTGTLYAYASSLTVPGRIPEDVKFELRSSDVGIGRVLRKCRAETYRELLWFGSECSEAVPASVRASFSHSCISRTYRIFCAQTPMMLITEKFPADISFGDSSVSNITDR